MSLNNTAYNYQYTGNAVTTSFATVFAFLENSDVSVLVLAVGASTPTILNQGTDYTISGAGVSSGGTIVCTVAPASGAKITVLRTTPLTQQTTFEPNDALPASALENGLDKSTMILQEQEGTLTKCIQFPTTEPSNTNSTLPIGAARAGQILGFDGNGNLTLLTPSSGGAVQPGSVNTASLAPGAVTNSILAANAVNDSKIQANGVGNASLAQANAATIKGNLTGAVGNVTDNSLIATSNALDLAFTTLASASTVNIGGAGSNFIHITGTTAVNAFDTVASGITRKVTFTGALSLVYGSGTIILPTGANITTAAGDTAVFVSEGAGLWRCLSYQTASGAALVLSPAQLGVIGIVGEARGLVGSSVGGAGVYTASWTADELRVETALGGLGYKGASLNLSFNGATTGANGMDTGAMPTASSLYVYAIYNPSTNTWATLGTVSGTGASIYPGANMPSGYTASALLWAGVTSAGVFQKFNQFMRLIVFPRKNVFNNTLGEANIYVSVSLSSIVPVGARLLCAGLGINPSGNGYQFVVSSDTNGTFETYAGGYAEGGGTLDAELGCGSINRMPILTSQAVFVKDYAASGSVMIDVNGYEI